MIFGLQSYPVTFESEIRDKGIGASEAGIILGVNTFKSVIDLWKEKTGKSKDEFEGNELTHWGKTLEPVVAEHYAKETGVELLNPLRTYIHRQVDYLYGSPDRLILKRDGGVLYGLEIKTTGAQNGHKWGEQGTDEIDIAYLPQVHCYMSIFGVDRWDVAVLIGGQKYRCYTVRRDLEFETLLLDKLEGFWSCVTSGRMPTAKSLEDVEKMYDAGGLDPIMADDDVSSAVDELARIKAEIKDLEAQAEDQEFKVKDYMGDADILIGLDGNPLCTWKAAKPSRRFDGKAFAVTNPILYESYMVEKPGSRRFILKGAK